MPAISVKGLTKAYGSLQAVKGTSFSVEEGEVFSLLGPNGAGKTTSVEMLEGLRERDGGEIRVLGMDPWEQGYELHKKIGVIPQDFRFFTYTTPAEAVAYYAALFGTKADAKALLKQVILEDSAKVPYSKLSGGQKQKMGLALSLVNDPRLVFLDEPTTGLDPQARRAVWEVIRGLKREGRTVLLTTHYLEEAEELADRVAIMDHGEIVAMGTPGEIIRQYGSGERLVVRADESLADSLRANGSLEVSYEAGYVSVALRQKHDAVAALAAIEESGLPWDDLKTVRDSLEDIFVKLVGKGQGGED